MSEQRGYGVNDLFPSKWLSGADVGNGLTVKIYDLTFEPFGQGQDATMKPVLWFHEPYNTKGFVLNKSNAELIAMLHGNTHDQWWDKEITLFTIWDRVPSGQMKQLIKVQGPENAYGQPGGPGGPPSGGQRGLPQGQGQRGQSQRGQGARPGPPTRAAAPAPAPADDSVWTTEENPEDGPVGKVEMEELKAAYKALYPANPGEAIMKCRSDCNGAVPSIRLARILKERAAHQLAERTRQGGTPGGMDAAGADEDPDHDPFADE